MSASAPADYRLAAPRLVRLVGGLLVLGALVVFVGTFVVAALDGSIGVLVLVALGLLGALVAAIAWLRNVVVVHLDESGYAVRLVRGAGVKQAAWRDVAEATTSRVAGEPVVVLTLHDQRTTTIPVSILAADREEFVRDLQRRLQRGQGLRPLA